MFNIVYKASIQDSKFWFSIFIRGDCVEDEVLDIIFNLTELCVLMKLSVFEL